MKSARSILWLFLLFFVFVAVGQSMAMQNTAERNYLQYRQSRMQGMNTSVDKKVLNSLSEDVYVPSGEAQNICQALGGTWDGARCNFSLSAREIAEIIERASYVSCQSMKVGDKRCHFENGNCVCDVEQVVNILGSDTSGSSSTTTPTWEPVPVAGERVYRLNGLMINGDRWQYAIKRYQDKVSVCAIKARRGEYYCGAYVRVGEGTSRAVYPPTGIEAARLETNGTNVRLVLRDGYGRDRTVIDVRFDVSQYNSNIPVRRTRDATFKISTPGDGSWTWHYMYYESYGDEWTGGVRLVDRPTNIPWMRK